MRRFIPLILCLYGDLHMGNIALDVTDESADAYIFDPGACRGDVAGRDIASLELSAILHQRIPFDSVVEICSVLYRLAGVSGDDGDADRFSD